MPRRDLPLAAMAMIALSSGALADPIALKDTVPHITTTGQAVAEVVPDQADIRLGVTNERPTADAATEATAQAAGEVIAEMKARGIDPRDIKTSFSLTAQYDEQRGPRGFLIKRTLRGYQSAEHITARIRDVSKAGGLARAFIEKGANAFEGIGFSYSKEDSKRQELKARAIRDALARAKIYTDAIRVKLSRVLQIGEEGDGGVADMPSRRVAGSGDQPAVAIPTEPGVQRIEEDITVIWEIEGNAP